MTTREFNEKLAKYGYRYHDQEVFKNKHTRVAVISENHERYVETEPGIPIEVFDLIVEYARTPIDERVAEEKYYWKLKGLGPYYEKDDETLDYFNKSLGFAWTLSSKSNNTVYETKFTEKKFNYLKKVLNITAEFEKEPIKEER